MYFTASRVYFLITSYGCTLPFYTQRILSHFHIGVLGTGMILCLNKRKISLLILTFGTATNTGLLWFFCKAAGTGTEHQNTHRLNFVS